MTTTAKRTKKMPTWARWTWLTETNSSGRTWRVYTRRKPISYDHIMIVWDGDGLLPIDKKVTRAQSVASLRRIS